MRFWDREREIGELKRYLQSEPNAILFVYGPKSSGKSTLLMRIIEEMGKEVYPYYYDLRLVPVSGYKDVLRIFFRERGWRQKLKEAIPEIASIAARYFEVDGSVLEDILSMKLNPFEVIEGVLRSRRKGKRVPVVVFDEIQKLKDVYMNGQRTLIKELFNFFVTLTKVRHLSHVIVMTSDTFFIEEVYSDSALKNTSEYYLVDYFDDETALKILTDEGLSEEDARYAVEWIGGVPWMIERILSNGNVKEKVKELYKDHRARLREFLLRYDEYERAMEVLKDLLDGKDVLSRENLRVIEDMVRSEILFYDPLKSEVRFQTRLDERAAREILKV